MSRFKSSLQNYIASFVTPFSSFVRMHTDHLEVKQLLLKIAELEKWFVCMEAGESFSSIVDSVFEQAWPMILQPILRTSTEEACEDTRCSVMANLSSSMYLLLKKVTQKSLKMLKWNKM